jgi:lipopolysaccharide/colanic/teichoic acid biosynthesis glycosyltransferase
MTRDPSMGRGGRPLGLTKRLMDILVSVPVLVVTGPLLMLAAVAVKMTSPGPVLYRARRAGLAGRPFDMLKFRTMLTGTDAHDRKITAAQDDRVTRVGGVLRRFRIDELPQLWNVLRGEMSVVGPRPEDWEIVQSHYTAEHRRTLDARPGMVSPADLRWYPDLTYHDPVPPGVSAQEFYVRRHLPIQVAEGIRYVDQQSLLLDLKIIGQTIFCVVVRSWWLPERRAVPGDPWCPDPLDRDVSPARRTEPKTQAASHS